MHIKCRNREKKQIKKFTSLALHRKHICTDTWVVSLVVIDYPDCD